MDDTRFVRRLQRGCDLTGDRECLVQGDRSWLQPIRQRRSLDQLEHQGLDGRSARVGRWRVLHAMDTADVWMIQRREHFRFPLEPGQSLWVGGKRLGQHLQRDIAVERGIAGAIHLTRATFAELGGDFVRPDTGADL